MQRKFLTIGAVLVSSSLLAACNWTWLPTWLVTLLQLKPANTALVNSYPVKIHNDCLRNDKQIDVVHIVVDNIDPEDLETSTFAHYRSDDHGNASQGTVAPPPPTRMPGAKTHVDFEAAPYLARRGEVALIEVELTDKRYIFMPGGTAVITSDKANGYMFCIKRDTHVSPDGRHTSFYVRWVPKVDGQPVIGAYNFMVIDRNHHRRFLPVDPEVKNEG